MRFKPLCATLLLASAIVLVLPAAAQAESCAYTARAASVHMPGRPFAVKATTDGCWLFVSLTGDPKAGGGIVALRNQDGTFRVAHVVHVSGQPGGMALSHDGHWLAAAAQDRTLLIDVAKLETGDVNSVAAEIVEGVGTGAIYAQFALDDRALFVSEEERGRLAVMDVGRAVDGAGEAAVIGRVGQGLAPVGLALSPDGRWLYVTSEIAPESANWPRHCTPEGGQAGKDHAEGMLSVVDVAAAMRGADNRSIVAEWAAGCGPVRVALSPDGATAWVTARGDNTLLGFRTRDLKGVQPATSPDRQKVGVAPVGVAVRPDGSEV